MKRKSVIVLVFSIMVLAILCIGVIISDNLEVVKFALTTQNARYMKSAIQFLVSVSLVFLCWISLVIIFIRLLKSDNFIEFGKKDSLTKIGNKNLLAAAFNHKLTGYGNQSYLVYFSFSAQRFLSKYNAELLNQIQKAVAVKLSDACMRGECAARLGDGEFGMILIASDGLRAQQRIQSLINEINQCQYQTIYEIFVLARAGFCSVNEERLHFLTALGNAKIAYQHARNHSMASFLFTDRLLSFNEQNKCKAQRFSEAIKNKEFEAYVQLIYDVKKKKHIGVEVLSRWNSEEGFMMPGSYIGDMHECGIIKEFDMYMFEKACDILQSWAEDNELKDLFVSCNITRTSISSDSFTDDISAIMKRYHFPHDKLIIEVTEDALIDYMDVANHSIQACKDLGFRVALDDFGAGHTSFSDIHNYPFDQLKIDRQFAKSLTTERGATLMGAFVEMAHNLGISVICEGVETKEQASAAKKLKFDLIQGYYYSYVHLVTEVKDKLHS